MEGLDSVGSLFEEGLGAVVDGITSLGETIGNFFSDLLDGILSGLESLFVPSVDFGDAFGQVLDEKFPIIDQVTVLVEQFTNLGSDVQAPQFTFTYYGVEVSIVNFEDFEQFIPVVKGIISAIAWFTFLFKLYKRLPGIIGGFK